MLVPMELSRIFIREMTDMQIIELSEVDGERRFPIVIALPEALAIERRLKNVEIPRPQTHDLLAAVMANLGGELKRIVINLIDNAIKFTQTEGTIGISLESNMDVKKIVIEDNGPGIPKDSVNKVFDRFFRDQMQQHIEGSGLGLSLVNAVLHLHKASIHLEENHPGLKVVIVL